MERPIIIDAANAAGFESVPRSDILAMLAMIDYLIIQASPIDEVSTACLVMARKSLAAFAGGLPKPQ